MRKVFKVSNNTQVSIGSRESRDEFIKENKDKPSVIFSVDQDNGALTIIFTNATTAVNVISNAWWGMKCRQEESGFNKVSDEVVEWYRGLANSAIAIAELANTIPDRSNQND